MTTAADYQQGWNDCRTYCHEGSGSAEYHAGFNAAVEAYYAAVNAGDGWNVVPDIAPLN